MKKILCLILAICLITLSACGVEKPQESVVQAATPQPTEKVEKQEKEEKEEYVYVPNKLSLSSGDKNVKTVYTNVDKEDIHPGERVEIFAEFAEGYELAYWFTPTCTEVTKEDGKYFFTMPNHDCTIMAKSQKIGEKVEKKQYRYEFKVINGGAPGLQWQSDYYNEGDALPTGGYRPFSQEYTIEVYRASDGKEYDWSNLKMPPYDLTVVLTLEME